MFNGLSSKQGSSEDM